ncbi:hypothetical protein X946_5559 [Burkholderia sp. ABCPW 111]|nr:hypothetical protein X946_5559 [Burkholderia sp. ABCPW 111]
MTCIINPLIKSQSIRICSPNLAISTLSFCQRFQNNFPMRGRRYGLFIPPLQHRVGSTLRN